MTWSPFSNSSNRKQKMKLMIGLILDNLLIWTSLDESTAENESFHIIGTNLLSTKWYSKRSIIYPTKMSKIIGSKNRQSANWEQLQIVYFKAITWGTAVAQCIRLFLPSCDPGSDPKHTNYHFSEITRFFNQFMYLKLWYWPEYLKNENWQNF